VVKKTFKTPPFFQSGRFDGPFTLRVVLGGGTPKKWPQRPGKAKNGLRDPPGDPPDQAGFLRVFSKPAKNLKKRPPDPQNGLFGTPGGDPRGTPSGGPVWGGLRSRPCSAGGIWN